MHAYEYLKCIFGTCVTIVQLGYVIYGGKIERNADGF
jgi:hypothetical protein